MTDLITYLIVGIVTGSIYAIAATGLVVTYTTSRIFNFAHGSIGMFVAFCYYQMRIEWGWPTALALAVSVLVLAPAIGAVLDVVIMRRLQDHSLSIKLTATLSLFIGIQGIAFLIWGSQIRVLPPNFGTGSVRVVGSLRVTADQLTTVGVALAVAVALWAFFTRTRLGTTMRAVVDNPALAQMHGIRPGRVTATSWALGSSLAGLAAILVAPNLSLSISNLSLLVVAAYAAAIIGKLSSAVGTFLGAIGLGVLTSLLVGYVPTTNSILANASQASPFIVLFIVLLVQGRQQVVETRSPAVRELRPPGTRSVVVWSVVGIAAAFAVAPVVSGFNALVIASAVIYAAILVSLIPVAGVAGQTSIAQFAFVGLGAVLVAHLANHMPWLLAAVVATLITGVVGALVALPALRLRGLYLALSTLAFAILMDQVVFVNPDVMSEFGSGLFVPRPSLFGVELRTQASMIPLFMIVLVVFCVVVAAVRRGSFGRALVALRDAPAAASALGLNIVRAKIGVFFLCSAMAGFAGCLYGGMLGGVSPSLFSYFMSLTALLLLAMQGLTSISGAVVGGVFYVILYQELPRWISDSDVVAGLQPILLAAGIFNLALHPEGVIAQQFDAVARIRERWGQRQSIAENTDAVSPTAAPASAATERS
ncbi:ABC transporter permease [Streptomyces sp. NPDC002143]